MKTLIGHVAVFAHQGGWDEILLVAGPIVVVIGLLAVVRRRLGARVAQPIDASDALESRSDS